MNGTFTPGPWRDDPSGYIYGPSGSVAGVFDTDPYSITETEANARLIAAAPDLYAALTALADRADRIGGDRDGMPECPWCKADAGEFPDYWHHDNCELVAARAALAKVEQP